MRTEFRKAVLPEELRSLQAFDRKVFPKSDWFPAAHWHTCESYWLLIDGVKAGCCALQPHADFLEDLNEDNAPARGTLYISSTGILPRYQGRGFGQLLKCWQIAYARQHRFARIVTNTRQRNAAMIALNRKFGFRIVRISPRYYSGPSDATVVMELLLA